MSEILLERVGFIYYGEVAHDIVKENVARLTKEAAGGSDETFFMQFPQAADGKNQRFCYVWWKDLEVAKNIIYNLNSFTCSYKGASYSFSIEKCKSFVPRNVVENTLTSTSPVDPSITAQMVDEKFRPFSLGNYFSSKITTNKAGKRQIVVHYDRTTKDAMSAMIMNKICYFDDDKESRVFFEYQRRN